MPTPNCLVGYNYAEADPLTINLYDSNLSETVTCIMQTYSSHCVSTDNTLEFDVSETWDDVNQYYVYELTNINYTPNP